MQHSAPASPAWRPLWQAMRPPFLLLTPACLSLGFATAHLAGASFPAWLAIPLCLAALFGHISVNLLNEYEDFRSGLDALTQRTPFSGGSGALIRHPQLAPRIRRLGLLFLGMTLLLGLGLVWSAGWQLLLPGMVAAGLVVAYTPVITRRPWLCLIAPGTGFGLVMVAGSHWVLAGHLSMAAVICALIAFFLVNNLLLLNQLPDIEADRQVGRRHLPMLWGRTGCVAIYGLFATLAYLSLVAGVVLGALPDAALSGLSTLPLALMAGLGLRRHTASTPPLFPLAANVAVSLLTPVLVAAGIFAGH